MSHEGCLSPRVLSPKLPSLVQRRVPLSYVRSLPQRRVLVTAAALKGVLCDLDGVIYSSGHAAAIPGAAETLRYFRERRVPWLFVTNTNTKPRSGLAAKLRELGIPCNPDDIVTPAKLAADWLRANDVAPAALFIAPELEPEFEGIPVLPPTAESGAAAVVIGDMGLDWNYATINRAFRLVMEGNLRNETSGKASPRPTCDGFVLSGAAQAADCDHPCSVGDSDGASTPAGTAGRHVKPATGPLTVLSLGKGRYYKDSDGYSIDVGPFTAAIEFASDQKAVVLGKPDPLIFCMAAKKLGLKPDEVVMIGDDVRGDVGGAQAAGLQGVLVRTGKFREHDLQLGVTPNAVIDSIADMPTWWEAQQQASAGSAAAKRPQQHQPSQQQQHQQQQHQQHQLIPGLLGAGAHIATLVGGARSSAKRGGKPALVTAAHK